MHWNTLRQDSPLASSALSCSDVFASGFPPWGLAFHPSISPDPFQPSVQTVGDRSCGNRMTPMVVAGHVDGHRVPSPGRHPHLLAQGSVGDPDSAIQPHVAQHRLFPLVCSPACGFDSRRNQLRVTLYVTPPLRVPSPCGRQEPALSPLWPTACAILWLDRWLNRLSHAGFLAWSPPLAISYLQLLLCPPPMMRPAPPGARH